MLGKTGNIGDGGRNGYTLKNIAMMNAFINLPNLQEVRLIRGIANRQMLSLIFLQLALL